MIIFDATPHDVHLFLGDNKITFVKSDVLPRVKQESTIEAPLNYNGISIPLKKTTLSEIEELPDETEGIFYIVSLLVLEAGKKLGRKDLLAPDTFRDSQGIIIGCSGFLI